MYSIYLLFLLLHLFVLLLIFRYVCSYFWLIIKVNCWYISNKFKANFNLFLWLLCESVWITDSYPMQYLGYCMMCNSLNPSRLFNPMHRKVTPNKDRSAIRMTPLSLLFSLYLSATQKKKQKKLSFFRSFSTQNSKTLSHHCSISMAIARRHCVPHLHYPQSFDTFLSLSFSR